MITTDNLTLATTLRYYGIPLFAIDKSNPRKAKFQFQDDKKVKKVIQDYWTGNLLCEPKNFQNAQKELKNMLYDTSYSGGV